MAFYLFSDCHLLPQLRLKSLPMQSEREPCYRPESIQHRKKIHNKVDKQNTTVWGHKTSTRKPNTCKRNTNDTRGIACNRRNHTNSTSGRATCGITISTCVRPRGYHKGEATGPYPDTGTREKLPIFECLRDRPTLMPGQRPPTRGPVHPDDPIPHETTDDARVRQV